MEGVGVLIIGGRLGVRGRGLMIESKGGGCMYERKRNGGRKGFRSVDFLHLPV